MLRKDIKKTNDILSVILSIAGVVFVIAIAMSSTLLEIAVKFFVSLIIVIVIGKHIEKDK